jgi:hypothetical protein
LWKREKPHVFSSEIIAQISLLVKRFQNFTQSAEILLAFPEYVWYDRGHKTEAPAFIAEIVRQID